MASNRLLQADEVEGTLTGRNYITNGNAERNVIGMSAYADTAGAVPVDMTGGSPSATITRTTSSPLRGVGSFLITKGASNLQGNGVSTPFTIDTCDQAKILTITFDYAVASGTFNFNGASYSSPSDLAVYVYDVTNSVLLYPSNSWLDGSGKFIAQFQTSSNSTSYRVGLHIATTNASAWTFKFDNLKVGSVALYKGTVISDWTSFTPTLSNYGNATVTSATYRRVGDSLEAFIKVTIGSSAPTGNLTVNLPSQFVIDSNKIQIGNISTGQVEGAGSSAQYIGLAQVSSSTSITVLNNATSAFWNATTPTTWVSGNFQTYHFIVPIVGWSSNLTTSSDYGNRQIIFTGQDSTSGTTLTANITTTIPFTKLVDTTGSFSSNTFTVPETGYYQIQAQCCTAAVTIGTTGTFYLELWQNGANVRYGAITIGSGGSTNYTATFNATLPFNAGDLLIMKGTSSVTTSIRTGITGITYMSINKVPNPQTMANGETMAMRATGAAPTGTLTSSFNTILFGTVEDDTHGAYVASTGIWTAAVSGRYMVSALVWMQGTLALNYAEIVGIYKNLSTEIATNQTRAGGAINASRSYLVQSGAIKLVAGDNLRIRSYSDASSAAYSNAANSFFAVHKVN